MKKVLEILQLIFLLIGAFFLNVIVLWPFICIWLIVCFLVALIAHWLGWILFSILVLFLILYLFANMSNSY